ncbi:MAG: NAD-dependent epimerase/dehydratase family protein [Myxococcales bacterium]|nr:NAD-dependent epimerase/dehydratase family protein [Myxococcales bacterium]
MARYAVTGASGRLGNVLVRHLLQRGHAVRVLCLPADRDCEALAALEIETVIGSVLETEAVDALVAGCDGVFHLAARIDLGSDREGRTWAVNVDGTREVVRACVAAGARLVHCSSHAALQRHPLDQPLDERRPLALDEPCAYHRAKAHAEQHVLEAVAQQGLEAVICSPATLIGPWDFEPSLFGGALVDLVSGRIPIMLDVLSDYADARDVADGMIAAMDRGRSGERYLLSGQVVPMRDFLVLLAEVSGRPMPRRILPLWVGWAMLPLTWMLAAISRKPPLFTPGVLRAAVWNTQVHHDKAAAELGFCPRPVADSLRESLDWYRERGLLARS